MSYKIALRLFIRLGIALSIVLATLATQIAASPAYAQSSGPVVNSLDDPGNGICVAAKCTLRDAIAAAPAGATITITASGILYLYAGELLINKNLTIQGSGRNALTIDAGGLTSPTSRVFAVAAGSTVTITNIGIIGGNVGPNANGGGILNHGTLMLNGVGIASNLAKSGGGIYNDGNLTITNSTLGSNTASSIGGGIASGGGSLSLDGVQVFANAATGNGGGIYTVGPTTIRRSTIIWNRAASGGGTAILNSITIAQTTISGNVATVIGGGVYQLSLANFSLQSVTITSNAASYGGGIYIQGSKIDMTASILATNRSTSDNNQADINEASRIWSHGYNLIGVVGAGAVLESTDHAGTAIAPLDPKLNSLTNNQYQLPLPGSPAIDAIPAASCTDIADQIGSVRPQSMGCDIGAIEVPAPTVSAGGPYTANEGRDLLLSATGTDPNGSPLTYRWDLNGNGFQTVGQQATIAGATLNGPATLTVRVQVTNAAGQQAIGQATITVLNLRPSATLSVPQTVSGGQNFTIALLNGHDPSPLDTLSYTFDCGDGLGFRAASSSSSISCPSSVNGGELYIRARVFDNNGAYTPYSAIVTVYPTAGGVG
jgi:CSLREA domain-containing protein